MNNYCIGLFVPVFPHDIVVQSVLGTIPCARVFRSNVPGSIESHALQDQ